MIETSTWPERLAIRDTGLHDDLGGPGQRIYTTAGRGYERVGYVRADLYDAAQAEVARLTAALADAETRGWQPIETAPTDTTEVIVLCGYKDVRLGWYFAPSSRTFGWRDQRGKEIVPSHWMPLPPAPPAASDRGGVGMSDALEKLIEAVEAGDIPDSMKGLKSFDRLASAALPQDVRALNILAWQAYIGRLDPAKTLHEALLPGWGMVYLNRYGLPPHRWLAEIANMARRYPERKVVLVRDNCPARAWLLAILRAYAAEVSA